MNKKSIKEKEHPIHDAFVKKEKSLTDKIAKFAGDIRFVYVHTILFIVWIFVNMVMDDPFDPYPFIFLTFVVSLEAIFLSTFVLINQNKDAARSDNRAKLDYSIDRRAEKEIAEIKDALHEIKKALTK